jgi:hypothetical protein
MPPEVSATFPRCSQGRHGAGVMNGKPACQKLLLSSVLSRRLEHKIKRTSDRGKRKEDTRHKTTSLNSKKRHISFGFSDYSECVTGFSIINLSDLSYKTQTQGFLTVGRRNVLYETRSLKYPEHWRRKFRISWDKCLCLNYTKRLSLWIVSKVIEWQ